MSLSTVFPSVTPSLNLNFVRNNRLDPRLTYSRASSGTYVGSDGYIKTAAIDEPRFEYDPVSLAPRGLLLEGPRTNLVLYSEDFSNADWTNVATNVTTNTTAAPPNSLTADMIVANATSARHEIRKAITLGTSKTYTFSVFAKQASGVYNLVLAFGASANGGWDANARASVRFNLLTGVVAATTQNGNSSHISSSITPAGNGWYRCVWTFIPDTTGATAVFGPGMMAIPSGELAAIPWTGDGTSGVYVWGAQLEEAYFSSSYIQTTSAQVTRATDNMEIVDRPIIDARTNIQIYSDRFDLWVTTGLSIVSNAITSPDGVTKAQQLIASSGTASHRVYSPVSLTITSGEVTTLSVYAKYIDRKYIRVLLSDETGNLSSFQAIFDISNGTTYSTNADTGSTYISSSITPAGDGWYRLTVTGTMTGHPRQLFYVNMMDDSASRTWTFDNTSVYLWGAQVESGSSASDYIPTVASTVTIPAPARTISDNRFTSWYNQANGSFVISSDTFKADNTANTTYSRIFNLSDGTASNRITLYFNTIGGVSCASDTITGMGMSDSNSGVASKNVQKIGLNLQTANSFMTHNGIPAGSIQTDSNIPNVMNKIEIGRYGTSGGELNGGWGHIQYLLYYSEPLPLAQLQALTK
jgi:hypothetical protein